MSVVLWLNAADAEDSPGDSPGDVPVVTGEPVYDARALRQAFAMLLWSGVAEHLAARGGLRPDSVNAVTVSGNRAEVAEFTAVVNTGTSAITGPYVVAVAARAHPIPPADDQPRIDAIVLRVADDDEDGTGARAAFTEYITGQPTADPAPPDIPRGAVRLALLDVLAGGAVAVSSAAPATVASGGVLPVPDVKALPADGIYEGAVAWVQSDNALRAVDDSGAWQPIASPAAHVAATGLAGTASQYVGADVTATSNEYTPLEGGPEVTVEIGPSGKALVMWGMRYAIASDAETRLAQMHVAMSGANEGGFGGDQCEGRNSPKRSKEEGWTQSRSAQRMLTDLKPGETTFTAEYSISNDSCVFDARCLTVIPL